MNTKKQPLVSIIIPEYNAYKYLKYSIDSALAQTYKNIEIIVVNDGSKDNNKTRKIATSYGDKIKYIEKENGGVSTALNLAIKNMSGEYFSWLSHDDYYYPNKIEEQIKYLNSLPSTDNVILYSDYDLMNKKSKVYATSVKNHEELTKKPEYALLRGSVNGITLLIPKKAFDDCGMFDENLRCTQDYELWERMQKKYTFVHQPKILATTRLHKEQQGNTNPKMLTEGDDFWTNLVKNTSSKTMERLEGTVYNFYCEMYKFLKTTPYEKTAEFVSGEIKHIEKECKKNLKKIKVSVIIPFYNRIPSVCNAVKSVLGQTHKNFEIILINDGSTEDITKLLSIINKHDNIKLIKLEQNYGPAKARNIGMENASGEYIAFLDSDDLFVKEKLETQLLEMKLTGYLFSHTSYIRKGFDTEIVMNTAEYTNGMVVPKIICSCGIATPTLMIHKDLYKDDKFRYNTNLKIGEDVCLYLKSLKDIYVLGITKPLTIVNVSETTCAYNYDKQLEGLKNIINYVINDVNLTKYDTEISYLFKEYIRVVDEKNASTKIEQENAFQEELKEDIPYIPSNLRGYISLYKNDRPLLKKVVLYKLRNHPRILKIVKFNVKILKRILGRS